MNHIRRDRRAAGLLLACLAALAAAGCAAIDGEPRYRTEVTRVPPPTAAGRQCLNQCDANRLQCEQARSAEADRCEADRRARFRDCRRRAAAERAYCLRNRAPLCDVQYSNVLTLCERSIPGCTRDLGRCQAMDARCFERCGGTIRQRRVCVANCD